MKLGQIPFAFRYRFPELQDIHEVLPAFMISILVYLVVSRLTSKRCPAQGHLDRLFTRYGRS